MRRLRDFLTGLFSLATLLALLVGVPFLLVLMVGRPWPDAMPDWAELRSQLELGHIPEELLMDGLALLAWFIWIQLVVAFVVEAVAAARGRLAGRAPVLPGMQMFAGKLITSILLLISALSPPKAAGAAPLQPIAITEMADQAGSSIQEASYLASSSIGGAGSSTAVAVVGEDGAISVGGSVDAVASSRVAAGDLMYETVEGDSWWDVAERLVGDGLRWREVRDLNVGASVGESYTINAQTEDMYPGWMLKVPGDADPSLLRPAETVAASQHVSRSETPQVVQQVEERESIEIWEQSDNGSATAEKTVEPDPVAYEVKEGDNLWDIAEEQLGEVVAGPKSLSFRPKSNKPRATRFLTPT